MVLKQGGRVGLSDDSHGKQSVGVNYDRLGDYLKRSGIAEIYYLESRGNVGGRTTRPTAVGGDWMSDAFWDRGP